MKKCKCLIEDALLCLVEQNCQKAHRRSLDRASSWVSRANKQNVSSSNIQPAQPSEPLFWSSGLSDAPRMLFLTLQVLGAVSLSFIHSFNALNVAQRNLPYKQRAHLFIKTHQTQTLKPKHIAFVFSYSIVILCL